MMFSTVANIPAHNVCFFQFWTIYRISLLYWDALDCTVVFCNFSSAGRFNSCND